METVLAPGLRTSKQSRLAAVNDEMLRRIPAVVDPKSPWQDQVRQAIEAWIGYAESQPAITLSWIREVPTLSVPTCRQDMTEAFVGLIQLLCDTEPMRAAGSGRSRVISR